MCAERPRRARARARVTRAFFPESWVELEPVP